MRTRRKEETKGDRKKQHEETEEKKSNIRRADKEGDTR